MGAMNKDSLKIGIMTGIPPGHRMVNGLPSRLIRRGDVRIFDIYVMDADGGNLQNLTNHHAWDGAPSWSPNSECIAFRSSRDGNSEIYVMDADGGNLQNPHQ